jgi:ribosome-binding protein aMBF1 (putative translation factor)
LARLASPSRSGDENAFHAVPCKLGGLRVFGKHYAVPITLDVRISCAGLSAKAREFRETRYSFTLSPRESSSVGYCIPAYLGQIHAKDKKPSQRKPLPASVKTMADWIRVKLHEHGIAPHQLGFKMGIAAAVVNAWKEGVTRPKASHVREMVKLLGKYCCSADAKRLIYYKKCLSNRAIRKSPRIKLYLFLTGAEILKQAG